MCSSDLLLLTLVVSQFVIVQSVLRSSHWILQRQWIAGNALAFFLASFLLEIFFRSVSLPQRGRQILPIFLFLFGSFLVSRAILDHIRHPMVPVVPLEQSDQLLAQRGAKEELQESDFTILAHQNLMQGGPVWKVFQRYYSVDLKAIGAREE